MRALKKALLRRRRGELRCGICGKRLSKKTANVDHIVPVSRGGTDDLENLQLAHPRCNRIKGDSLPETPVVNPSGVEDRG